MKKLLLLLGLCFELGTHAQSVNITNVTKAANVPPLPPTGWALGLTNAGGPTLLIPYSASVLYDTITNTWGINTPFPLGTNAFITSAAATLGFTGVGNVPTASERWGQLTIAATGDVIFTNPPSVHANDLQLSRTISSGNWGVVSVDVIPGQVTNMAIAQFK